MFDFFKKKPQKILEELKKEEGFSEIEIPLKKVENNWYERLSKGLKKSRGGWVSSISSLFSGKVTEDTLSEFEELMIEGDIGVSVASDLIAQIRQAKNENRIQTQKDVREVLHSAIVKELTSSAAPMRLNEKPVSVILLVGINGVGKTTTTAKLSRLFAGLGKKCFLIAADTFRAGAVKQLETWGQRVGVEVFKGQEGEDPSSVVFSGLQRARELGADLVLVDTAGRLHTQNHLMEEIKKISRVIGKQIPGGPHETLMVIDATTGQNAISQARIFHQALRLSGLVITKLDGTARGGALLPVHRELQVPVRFIGVGESAEDIEHFNAKEFADALLHEEGS